MRMGAPLYNLDAAHLNALVSVAAAQLGDEA